MSLIQQALVMAGGSTLTTPIVPPFANVSLLLGLNGTNGDTTTSDESSKGHTVTLTGGAQLQNSIVKFGSTAAGTLDSGARGITVTSTADLTLGTGDFTIELWLYLTSGASFLKGIVDSRPGGAQGAYPCLYSLNGYDLRWWVNTGDRIIVTSVAANTLHHVAVVRLSSVTTIFINGVATGTPWADTTNYLSGSEWRFGRRSFSADGSINGYMDEIRVVKGVACYTGNFAPPSTEFPRS